jgi:hypothetical protein
VDEALSLAQAEQQRTYGLGHGSRVRDLILQQARILERMRRFDEAWQLLDGLAQLDRSARRRAGAPDDEVRTRELVVLTSLLRIARHSGRTDPVVEALRTETAGLAEDTPARVLTRNPSLLRDLAAEVGDVSPRALELATDVRGVDVALEEDAAEEPSHSAPERSPVTREDFVSETDESQEYR